MKSPSSLTRRDALKSAVLGALALPLLGSSRAAENSPPRSAKASGGPAKIPKLGLASYSLAKLPVEEVIAVMTELQLKGVSPYHTHVPWTDGTPAECLKIVEKFRAAGIAVTSTGMIDLPNDEKTIRQAFDNVRGAGLTLLCGWLKQTDSLPLVDKLVKEYDLRIAIHNHGPTQALATGRDVWNAVQNYDRRIGLCLDVGHGFRAGENAADTIRLAHERIYQVHLRDTGVTGGAMKDPKVTVMGHGLVNFPAILAGLKTVGFSDWADFEYEKKEEDRVPGLAESVGYVRGILAAQA